MVMLVIATLNPKKLLVRLGKKKTFQPAHRSARFQHKHFVVTICFRFKIHQSSRRVWKTEWNQSKIK